MNKYRRLLQNVGLFALNTVATKLISFLLIPLYTTYLLPGMFGVTDMAATVITLVTPLATLSIGDGLVRFLIEDGEHQKAYATFSFMLTLISCLIVALLLPVLDMHIFGGLGNYKLLFWATYSTNAFLSYLGNLARGLNKIKLIPHQFHYLLSSCLYYRRSFYRQDENGRKWLLLFSDYRFTSGNGCVSHCWASIPLIFTSAQFPG